MAQLNPFFNLKPNKLDQLQTYMVMKCRMFAGFYKFQDKDRLNPESKEEKKKGSKKSKRLIK